MKLIMLNRHPHSARKLFVWKKPDLLLKSVKSKSFYTGVRLSCNFKLPYLVRDLILTTLPIFTLDNQIDITLKLNFCFV